MAIGYNYHEDGRAWNEFDSQAEEVRVVQQQLRSLIDRLNTICDDTWGDKAQDIVGQLDELSDDGLDTVAETLERLADGR